MREIMIYTEVFTREGSKKKEKAILLGPTRWTSLMGGPNIPFLYHLVGQIDVIGKRQSHLCLGILFQKGQAVRKFDSEIPADFIPQEMRSGEIPLFQFIMDGQKLLRGVIDTEVLNHESFKKTIDWILPKMALIASIALNAQMLHEQINLWLTAALCSGLQGEPHVNQIAGIQKEIIKAWLTMNKFPCSRKSYNWYKDFHATVSICFEKALGQLCTGEV